jgi:hypothetical protein
MTFDYCDEHFNDTMNDHEGREEERESRKGEGSMNLPLSPLLH